MPSRTRAVAVERDRIEEGFDQADVVGREVRVKAVDRLGQHRVAEAVHDVRELGHDRRIDVRVIAVGDDEHVDARLDLAREFLEHEMLILHLGAELRRLEQALAVPHQRIDRRRADRNGRPVDNQPLVEERDRLGLRRAIGEHRRRVGEDHFLGVFDHPVMLGMEDVVHRGQADVLVDAAVAGDEVPVEQFVVVGAVGRPPRLSSRP